jgi:Zn-dependent protease
MHDPSHDDSPAGPRVSQIFLALLAVFGLAGTMLAIGQGGRFGVFVFVVVGWVISLCLHEFGHAATAYAGGDRSVAEQGYLSLNPIRYANPALSILLPLVFLAMGGIGFPGGAVYVNTAAIRTPLWRAATSAAGPVVNLVCLIAIGLALSVPSLAPNFAAALAFLALLQATALVLNLLPIPGLDGFGVIAPFLSPQLRASAMQAGRFVGLLLLVAIIALPQVLDPIWRAAAQLCMAFGVSGRDIAEGYGLFRFWG